MMDLILQMPRIPHPSESILGTTYSNAGGGKGSNSAVAAAKVGGDVSVCCTMGQDANGEALDNCDIVVLDPPRKGVERRLIEQIAEKNINRVVYISCGPDTLARDCKVFLELGYEMSCVYLYDLFPKTGHVESVVSLTRK